MGFAVQLRNGWTWRSREGLLRSGEPAGSSACIRRRTDMYQSGLAMKGFANNCESWRRNDGGSAIAA